VRVFLFNILFNLQDQEKRVSSLWHADDSQFR
jgi:hypothetical protein